MLSLSFKLLVSEWHRQAAIENMLRRVTKREKLLEITIFVGTIHCMSQSFDLKFYAILVIRKDIMVIW